MISATMADSKTQQHKQEQEKEYDIVALLLFGFLVITQMGIQVSNLFLVVIYANLCLPSIPRHLRKDNPLLSYQPISFYCQRMIWNVFRHTTT